MPAQKNKKCKILFLLKRRSVYSGYGHSGFSSGLWNSALFAAQMLERNGYCVKMAECTDNNDIDREVSQFKPNVCLIEALWVVPSKFAVLTSLHPDVIWIVRIHSENSFLSQEGIAVDWISSYPLYPNVYVAMNSIEGFHEVMSFWEPKGIDTAKLRYLPTFYPAPTKPYYKKNFSGMVINIACMGAIRVLKNTLIQAMAALRFVDRQDDGDWILRFHINVTRTEADGNAPYRNVVDLFTDTRHELIQHDWMSHKDFIKFMKEIDLGLQVSLSETFSIVAADMVSSGVPTVGSKAIRWLDKKSQADERSVNDIVEKMEKALKAEGLIKSNLANLRDDAKKSEADWLSVIRELCCQAGKPSPS